MPHLDRDRLMRLTKPAMVDAIEEAVTGLHEEHEHRMREQRSHSPGTGRRDEYVALLDEHAELERELEAARQELRQLRGQE